jgi:hypothetical protein
MPLRSWCSFQNGANAPCEDRDHVGLGIYVLISISSLLLPSEAAFADDSLELRESAVNKYLNACNAVEFIKQIEERQPSKLKFFSTDQDEKIFKKVIKIIPLLNLSNYAI